VPIHSSKIGTLVGASVMTWTSGGGGGAGFFLHPLVNKIKNEKQIAAMKRASSGHESLGKQLQKGNRTA